MRSMRDRIVVAFALVILGAVVYWAIPKHQLAGETAPGRATVRSTAGSSRPQSAVRWVEPQAAGLAVRSPSSSGENPVLAAGASRPESSEVEGQAGESEQGTTQTDEATPPASPTEQGPPPDQETIQDPTARIALAFVGIDPDAERYWYAAINDPSRSAHERQDLIEDLNEEGLFDPQNPTLEDLPLILNRIQLIETVFWDAMDEVNADAFLEAYKDLVNLALRASDNG
jgi:hypothetical protein